jgi:hypothetical protein
VHVVVVVVVVVRRRKYSTPVILWSGSDGRSGGGGSRGQSSSVIRCSSVISSRSLEDVVSGCQPSTLHSQLLFLEMLFGTFSLLFPRGERR